MTMILADAEELDRLCGALQSLEISDQTNPEQKEALRKAAIALHLTFLAKLRSKLELLYENRPLTEEEKNKLRAYGINPDAA